MSVTQIAAPIDARLNCTASKTDACVPSSAERLTGAGRSSDDASVTEIASLVLFAADAANTAQFYRAIGLELEHEDHGEGPVHFAVDLGGVHFATEHEQMPWGCRVVVEDPDGRAIEVNDRTHCQRGPS
jgi:hypothetical protein